MSLESGRKLGLTGSLIEIIAPFLMIVTLVAFLLYLFATAISSISSGLSPATPTIPYFAALEIFFILIGIAWFIGYVLFIIAMRYLSQYYNEPAIFRSTFYGFIVNIIAAVAVTIIEIILIFTSIARLSTGTTVPAIALATPTPTIPPSVSSFLTQFIIGYLAVLAVAFVLAIVSGIFYMRGFNKLAEKSGVDNFKTAGLLYLIGAATAIIGIGALIQWIAWIFAAMGYRSLKPKEPLTSPSTYTLPQPTASSIMEKKYCPYCGSENNANAIYCSSCGKQIK
jgi:uncharacterized membrane protein